MRFFVGFDRPFDAQNFDDCFISINALRRRRGDFKVNNWILDSGSFTQIARFGGFRQTPEEYAAAAERWKRCGNLLAVVSQDFMCESEMLKRTGLTVADHQRLTIERFDALVKCSGTFTVLPVLQGFYPADYVAHLKAYGRRLRFGAWIGVGSVCKRNTKGGAVEDILHEIKRERPDLRLHGFGLKTSSLANERIRMMLYSADSMAWSYAARKQGRNCHDWREADRFRSAIINRPPDAQRILEWAS